MRVDGVLLDAGGAADEVARAWVEPEGDEDASGWKKENSVRFLSFGSLSFFDMAVATRAGGRKSVDREERE